MPATKTESSTQFETLLERLQGLVERLEKGDLPLEQSLEVFEEGVKLSREGLARLDSAEARVEQLLADGSTELLEGEALEGASKEVKA